MINLTLSALLVRCREDTTFGIKGKVVFFTVLMSVIYAVQPDRSSEVVWVLCICLFLFLYTVSHELFVSDLSHYICHRVLIPFL